MSIEVGDQVLVDSRLLRLIETATCSVRLGPIGRVVGIEGVGLFGYVVDLGDGVRRSLNRSSLEKTAAQELIDAYRGR